MKKCDECNKFIDTQTQHNTAQHNTNTIKSYTTDDYFLVCADCQNNYMTNPPEEELDAYYQYLEEQITERRLNDEKDCKRV